MKKVRIGIIGCGGMSRYHGRNWTTEVPEAQIVALCDTRKENLERYQRELFEPLNQKPPAFADYRQMLSKVDLDGVMIVTPHDQHYEQAVAALDAGGHVLLEKPMVINVEQARKLVAHAKKAKRILSVGWQGSYCAEHLYIRDLLVRGELGEIGSVDTFVTQNWLKSTSGTWRQDPKLAGAGFAFDTGSHLFQAMLYLSDLHPTEVFAVTDNRGAAVEITAAALIRYDNGAMGTAICNGDSPKFEEGIHVAGTRGAVRTSVYGGRLEQWDARGQAICYPPVQPVPSMYQNFVDCILDRAQSPCPAIWGLRQALLMEALYESARTGKPVKVQPE